MVRAKWISGAGLWLCLLGVSLSAHAQQEGGGIQTIEEETLRPEEVPDAGKFEEDLGARGRVDRRHELNPLADRLMGWSSGYLPPAGVIQYTNTFLLGQKAAYSITDDLQVFGQGILPLERQSFVSAGVQVKTIEGDAWHLTTGGQLRYRRTNLEPGTADTALSGHAVFDVIASDNLSWSVGAVANVPLALSIEEVDFSGCETRGDFAEGSCYQQVRNTEAFPSVGYWLSLYAGLNYFVNDWLLLNAEVFTGVSQGNFFGLDAYQGVGDSYQAELEMVRDSSFEAGLGPLGPLTLGVGTTFVLGKVGLQTGLYTTSYGGQSLQVLGGAFNFIPYLAIGVNFGGER